MAVALKPRQCRCGNKFMPRNGLQRACSPQCALMYTRERAEKKRRRESRAWTRVQREALKTKPILVREAQAAFNSFIRARDRGLPCITCGGSPAQKFGGTMDCGHYRSTGSCPQLRFHEDNAAAQCVRCNRHGSGMAVEFRIALIKRIGNTAVEWLEQDHPMPKWTRDDLRGIRDLYRRRSREWHRLAA